MVRFVSLFTLMLVPYIAVSQLWTIKDESKTLGEEYGVEEKWERESALHEPVDVAKTIAGYKKALLFNGKELTHFTEGECLQLLEPGEPTEENVRFSWFLTHDKGLWKVIKGRRGKTGKTKTDKNIVTSMEQYAKPAGEREQYDVYKAGAGAGPKSVIKICGRGKTRIYPTKSWVIKGNKISLITNDGKELLTAGLSEGKCIELKLHGIEDPVNIWERVKERERSDKFIWRTIPDFDRMEDKEVTDQMDRLLSTPGAEVYLIQSGGGGADYCSGERLLFYPRAARPPPARSAAMEYENEMDEMDDYNDLLFQYYYDWEIEQARKERAISRLKNEKRTIQRLRKV